MVLNATPLGEVISLPTVYRHQSRAGLRFGDGSTIDLIRYAAWLFHQRREQLASSAPTDNGLNGYAAMKEAARQRNAELSAVGRDIGEIPALVDPARRQRATDSFRTFCETYFAATFHLPWSPDHLKVVEKIEQAVLHGGLFAMAMPRGSGKTSLCETACLWAILTGRREFVALIGSDEEHAAGMLESIKSELENNELLAEDFPEVCYPVQCLQGIANRCAGQTCGGERTQIGWTAKEIVLPTIAGSVASAAIIRVAGITGRIRGMKYKRADGRTVRPSLVLLDDPQTDESARSPSQCAAREQILAGAILGLAGPGNKIAGLMTLTVVCPGDMADRLLDRGKHPQWQGERTKMVYSFPSNEKLWAQYAELRARCLREEKELEQANAFYLQHREKMDAGAIVAWPQRHNPDEISAIQHAMNLKLDNEQAFYSEYQNEPQVQDQRQDDLLDADAICAKTNGLKRGAVPQECNHLTAFVDVQQTLLFWMVCGWSEDFTGYVLDYGAYPDPKLPYFTLRDARRTLATAAKTTGLEGAIYAGLRTLTDQLLGREWRRDDGAAMRIGRCLIDANWGNSTDVVYQFCRQSSHAALLMPSHGRYVGAASVPFDQYAMHSGDRVGHHWRIPAMQGRRSVRHVLVDTNFWKSFCQARLCVAMGDRGCLSMFGGCDHRLLADHLTAEYRQQTQGRGRTVDEWRLRTPGRDNHWLDCLVGCAVAASMLGAVLEGTARRVRPVKRVRLSELQRTAKVWRARVN
jgi:hypothetical protein